MFNLLTKDKTLEQAIEETKPLMQLVFYCMDKVKRYKLSREAKNKADKNRTKASFKHFQMVHSYNHQIAGCRESLEVNPCSEGREGGGGEGEEEKGAEGADQVIWLNPIDINVKEKTHFKNPLKLIIDILIREIEDPEKQRKMEERENRREKKKAQPKMKQLKVN